MQRVIALALITLSASIAASAATAGTPTTTYKAHVNAICRSYTPRLKAAAADMNRANAAGDKHRLAYDLGVLMGGSLSEGVKVETTPVPPTLKVAMAGPLRLLHSFDVTLRGSL